MGDGLSMVIMETALHIPRAMVSAKGSECVFICGPLVQAKTGSSSVAPPQGGCLRTSFALMCLERPLGLSEQVLEGEAEESAGWVCTLTDNFAPV